MMSLLVRNKRLIVGSVLVAAMSGVSAESLRDGAVPKRVATKIAPLMGDYTGQWSTELTENVYDDISRYRLEEPVLRLSLDQERRVRLSFYMDVEEAEAGQALDLLGFGCRSAVGPMLTVDLPKVTRADASTPHTVLSGTFDFDWGNCPSRVYAQDNNDLHVDVAFDPAKQQYVAHLKLLRSVQPVAKVYAQTKEGRREVKVRPKANGSRSVYNAELEYCVLNEVGETEACFPRKSELKTYLVPFPLPGFTALWYTQKTPKLTVDQGTKMQYHEADFRRASTPR